MHTPSQMLALLAETPPRLAALSADLAPAALQTRPAPEEWSLNEILAHLRACADVWGRCMLTILAEDTPTWRAVNPRSYIKQTNYPALGFWPSLDAFTTQRADLLAALAPLPDAAWSRAARVTGGGRPLELTLLSYAERLAVHERAHVRQMQRVAAALRR